MKSCVVGWLVSWLMLSGAAVASESFEVKGLLVPREEVALGSRAKGVIKMIKRDGDRVKTGDVVLELEDEAERLEVERQIKVLEKREFEAKANADLAQQKAISENDALDAKINLDIARILLAQARELLDSKRVRSSIDGVVTRRLRERGEAVDEFTPVLQIVNLSQVHLEGYVNSSRINQVSNGQKVRITVGALPGQEFQGQIDFVSPTINPASDEFRIKVRIDNPREVLRSGMSAVGRIEGMKLGGPVNP